MFLPYYFRGGWNFTLKILSTQVNAVDLKETEGIQSEKSAPPHL